MSESLWADWIIRVEYAEPSPEHAVRWQQWGEALFAIHDPEPVIAAIVACQAANPAHSMRLSAEKVYPRTRLMYCIERAEDRSSLVDQPLPGQAPRPDIAARRVQAPIGNPASAHRIAWRHAAIVGALLGSVLMVEQAFA